MMNARPSINRLRSDTAAILAALRGRRTTRHRPRGAAELRLSDRVDAAMHRDAVDFENMRRLLAFSLAPDANCIDIGAHRGAVLGEMLRVAPSGHHIAFEPLPHLCELLRSTFPQVDVHQAALSNHEGESSFAYVHGAAEGWSGLLYRPVPTGEHPEVEQITVRLEVLDRVIDPDYGPAVIKIDVEGAEQQVLEGALGTLRRHRPIVIFEHGSGSAETYGTSPADIHNLLTGEAGFRIFDLDGLGPYPLADFERTFYSGEQVNFVARV
jgi:FkbM family methyltransferase